MRKVRNHEREVRPEGWWLPEGAGPASAARCVREMAPHWGTALDAGRTYTLETPLFAQIPDVNAPVVGVIMQSFCYSVSVTTFPAATTIRRQAGQNAA